MSGEKRDLSREKAARPGAGGDGAAPLDADAGAGAFTAKLDFAKYLVKFIFLVFLSAGVFIDFYFLLQAKPDALSGVATVVRAVKLPQVLWGVAALLGYGWGWAEHSRHKRLTRELGELRRGRERADHPFDTRSGLDAGGRAPGGG